MNIDMFGEVFIRRIDDLGRVVIPKNIRFKLGIKEGDALSLNISEEGNLILKKTHEDDN